MDLHQGYSDWCAATGRRHNLKHSGSFETLVSTISRTYSFEQKAAGDTKSESEGFQAATCYYSGILSEFPPILDQLC